MKSRLRVSQLVERLHGCDGSDVSTGRVCTRNDTSVRLRESIPGPWRADVYSKALAKSSLMCPLGLMTTHRSHQSLQHWPR